MLVSLKDMLDHSGTSWQPGASVAFELLWVRVVNAGEPHESVAGLEECWMPANTYYSQLWIVKCDIRREDPLRTNQ